jgi:hypothetical protein
MGWVDRFRNSDVRNVVIVVAFAALLGAPRLRGPIDLRWDAAVYYILGTSMAEGKGYRLLNEPGEIHAIQYPPALPAVVAAHQLVLGTADPVRVGHAVRYTYFVLNMAYVAAVYAVARRFLAPALALPVAMGTCVYLFTVWHAELMFAELPFALTTVLFVALYDRGGRVCSVVTAALGVVSFGRRGSLCWPPGRSMRP